MPGLSFLVVYPCLSWVDHCVKLWRTCGTWVTVAAGCCTGLGGTAAVEDLASTGEEVGESLGPLAVEEACQTSRTFRNRPCNLDHSHIDPVVVSMSEIAQTGR